MLAVNRENRPDTWPTPGGDPDDSAVLRVEGLHKAFDGNVVLDDISFELKRGEVVLLRGQNGSGKTTLLNIITGFLEPDAGTLILTANGSREDLRFPKRWWQRFNPTEHFTPERVAAEGVSRTWQDARLFPTQSLVNNIAVAFPAQIGENPALALLRRHAVSRQEAENLKSAEETLSDLGLGGREASSADMVSLGQAKRVAIARAVKTGASILLLDEPLAGLDAEGISEVTDMLKRLSEEDGLTMVIVEHVLNLRHILDLATTVWTLEDGRLTVQPSAEVRKASMQLHRRPTSAHEVIGCGDPVTRIRLPGGAVLSITELPHRGSEDTVLEVDDLVVHRGRRLVIGTEDSAGNICGLSFKLAAGQIGILEAPNGWGKTTLLEALAGLVPITRGTIRFAGRDISSLPAWDRVRLGIALLQAASHSFPNLKTREVLRFACIDNTPENLASLLERFTSDLSGGERKKVGIACAHLSHTPLAMLDEPFAALDRSAQAELGESLLRRLGATLIAEPSSVQNDFEQEDCCAPTC